MMMLTCYSGGQRDITSKFLMNNGEKYPLATQATRKRHLTHATKAGIAPPSIAVSSQEPEAVVAGGGGAAPARKRQRRQQRRVRFADVEGKGDDNKVIVYPRAVENATDLYWSRSEIRFMFQKAKQTAAEYAAERADYLDSIDQLFDSPGRRGRNKNKNEKSNGTREEKQSRSDSDAVRVLTRPDAPRGLERHVSRVVRLHRQWAVQNVLAVQRQLRRQLMGNNDNDDANDGGSDDDSSNSSSNEDYNVNNNNNNNNNKSNDNNNNSDPAEQMQRLLCARSTHVSQRSRKFATMLAVGDALQAVQATTAAAADTTTADNNNDT